MKEKEQQKFLRELMFKGIVLSFGREEKENTWWVTFTVKEESSSPNN